MGKKYAIRYGYDKKNNKEVVNEIYDSWDEAKRYVLGVSSSEYKSFKESEIEKMNKYLGITDSDKNKENKKSIDDVDTIHLLKASIIKNNEEKILTKVCKTAEDVDSFLKDKTLTGKKIVKDIDELSEVKLEEIIARYFEDKVYVVKKGIDEDGNATPSKMFNTWRETEKFIEGKNVDYKSFYKTSKTEKEIKAFLTSDYADIKFKDIHYNSDVYLLKKGKCPNTGKSVKNLVFSDWYKAKTYLINKYGIKKYKNLKELDEVNDGYLLMFSYKDFLSPKEAIQKITEYENEYNNGKNTFDDKVDEFIIPKPSKNLNCYVDGSFNKTLNNYGAGLVCVVNNKIVHKESFLGKNKDAVSMWQIGGELLGAIQALRYAKLCNFNYVKILYDYKGIENYVTKKWKAKSPFTIKYKEWVLNFKKENPHITIDFQKIKAHDKHLFNEIADGLAKEAVDVELNPTNKKAMEIVYKI